MNGNSIENLDVPSWINPQYFEQILKNNEPNFKNILEFQPKAAIPPGENFTSVLWRINMKLEMKDGRTQELSYILKTMLDDAKGGKTINKLSLFPKELEMYKTYIPAFEQLYASIGWNIQMAPKCLYTEIKDERINFVFEDLKQKHFENVDRLQGCDMNHMTYILRKLAEFHAVSAKYEEQHGSYPNDFQKGFTITGEERYNIKTKTYKEAMLLWEMDDAENFVQKFPTFQQYQKSFNATLEQEKNKFNVLTHGDFWSSNIMFNYLSSGQIKELLFIDFQICKWGSPIEDLLFLITTSAANDIRLKEFDNFIAIYYERLIECLKALSFGQSLPKLRDLHSDIFDKRFSFFAFYALINHLVVVSLPSDVDSNLLTFSRNDEYGEEFRMRAYTNPIFVTQAKELFRFFHHRGLFNFEDYE